MLAMSIAFVTLLVIRCSRLHGRLSTYHDMVGVQKFNAAALPRISGVGVLIGAVFESLVMWVLKPDERVLGSKCF